MRREEKFTLIGQADIVPDVALGVCAGLDGGLAGGYGIPKKLAMSLDRIVLTGCGDSWMSANAAVPVFEKLAGLRASADRCIDYTRFRVLSAGESSALVAVSISGGVIRTKEAVSRASKYGIPTINVTNNPASATAGISDYVVPIGMPSGLVHGYGLHSYTCSVVTLTYLGVALALLRERITVADANAFIESFKSYIASYRPLLPSYSALGGSLAERWKALHGFDFVGDGVDFSTAYFSCANVFEEYGAAAVAGDSVNWPYASLPLKVPHTIGRVFVVNRASGLRERLLEDIRLCCQAGSPAIAVTDDGGLPVPDGCTAAVTPEAERDWMHAAMQHLPVDYLVGHIRKQLGVISFCADKEDFGKALLDGKDRLKGSKLVIV